MKRIVILCRQCDNDLVALIVEEALLLGWKSVREDDGPSWTHLGWCPACSGEQEANV
ncbi:MAG: hypothetical protein ACE5GO_11105 [Anaerolineales bacterium]